MANAPTDSDELGRRLGRLEGQTPERTAYSDGAKKKALALLACYRARDRLICASHMVSPSWEILLIAYTAGGDLCLAKVSDELGLEAGIITRWADILVQGSFLNAHKVADQNIYSITLYGASLVESALNNQSAV
jgi:DNA-binding MarR family transcriptional regulator